jgi:hypothetical protein
VPWKNGGELPHSKQEFFGDCDGLGIRVGISRSISVDCDGQDSPKTEILERTITFCGCRNCDKQNNEGKSAALSSSSFHEREALTGGVDEEVMNCRTGRVRGRKTMSGEG